MKLEELSFADLWSLSQYIDKEFDRVKGILDRGDAEDPTKWHERLYVLGGHQVDISAELRKRTENIKGGTMWAPYSPT